MPRHLWDQHLGETDRDYAAFRRWLAEYPRPLPAEPDVAVRHGWSDRAIAWDHSQDCPENDAEALRKLMRLSLECGIVASARYLEDLRSGAEPVDPRYPIAVLGAAARMQEVLQQTRPQAGPEYYSPDLPTEVLELLDELKQNKLLKGKI